MENKSDIIINIDFAEKEKILEEIINSQFELIKSYQEALDKFYGKIQIKMESVE